MKLNKIVYIQILFLLLFIIFLYKLGFDELVSGQNEIQQKEAIMKTVRFLGGFFLGFSIPIYTIISRFKKKQTNIDNYVEKKINAIFEKNFSSEIQNPGERLRNIDYEFLDYEIDEYIDIAIEISNKNINFLYQFPPIAFSIIGIIAFVISLPLANPMFLNGLLLGLILFIGVIVSQALDNFKNWKMMYYDLMLIKSNRNIRDVETVF